eukprot:gene15844-biopygen14288
MHLDPRTWTLFPPTARTHARASLHTHPFDAAGPDRPGSAERAGGWARTGWPQRREGGYSLTQGVAKIHLSRARVPHHIKRPPPPPRVSCPRSRRLPEPSRGSARGRRPSAVCVGGRNGSGRGGGGGREFSGFPGAHPGAQIRASRRASAPTRRAARARGGGGWDRRLVQLPNDCLGTPPSSFLASGWRKRGPGTWIRKKCMLFGILIVGSRTKSQNRDVGSFGNFRNLSRVGARDLGIPAFAPQSEPPRARAPGAQMIRMASGSSLAFQGLSRDTPNCILSVRLAGTRMLNSSSTVSVTEQVGQV